MSREWDDQHNGDCGFIFLVYILYNDLSQIYSDLYFTRGQTPTTL